MEMKTKSRGIRRLSMDVRQFFGNRSGVSAIEYALLVVAVLTLAGAGIAMLTTGFDSLFTETQKELKEGVKTAKKKATK